VEAGTIRVMVVDDHAVVRSGLRLLLEREEDIHCAGEAASAEDAIRAVERLAPSVILMDLQMPGMGGLAGIERLRQRAPAIPVLVLSMHDEPDDVRRAFAAGAAGYVLKTAADEDLVTAVRAVAAGGRYVHPTVGAILARPESSGPINALSEREREVLKLLAFGYTNLEIAEMLVLSVRTVESHRAHILAKLRVGSRAAMVRLALEAGMLEDPLGDGPPSRGPG
jgi:two-component system response regulator NreC